MKNAYIFCHHNTLIASFSAYLKPIKQYNKSSLNVVNRFLETATLSEMTYNKITPRCSSSNLFTTSNFVSVTFFFFFVATDIRGAHAPQALAATGLNSGINVCKGKIVRSTSYHHNNKYDRLAEYFHTAPFTATCIIVYFTNFYFTVPPQTVATARNKFFFHHYNKMLFKNLQYVTDIHDLYNL